MISESKFKDSHRISLWDLSSNWNEIRKFNDSSVKSNWKESDSKRLIQVSDKSLNKIVEDPGNIIDSESSVVTEVFYF